MNRRDPSERIWTALKQFAEREARSLSEAEAIKRVKAIVRREGALDLPEHAVRFYATEYRDMVMKRQKRG